MAFTFLDWSVLGTFSGAVGLTVILVQLLKLPLDRVWKIPTRYLVLVICFLVMLAAQVFLGKGINLEMVIMTAINAALGSLTAMALYERVIESPEWAKLNIAYEYIQTGVMPGDEAEAATEESEPAKETAKTE